jgi:hypothetical protein
LCVVFYFYKPGGNTKNNTPESIVLSECLRYLKIRGIYHWRNNTGTVQIAWAVYAVAAKSWTDIDQALREGGYVSDGPVFEGGDN